MKDCFIGMTAACANGATAKFGVDHAKAFSLSSVRQIERCCDPRVPAAFKQWQLFELCEHKIPDGPVDHVVDGVRADDHLGSNANSHPRSLLRLRTFASRAILLCSPQNIFEDGDRS